MALTSRACHSISACEQAPQPVAKPAERLVPVGLADPPLGGQASDIYLKLDQLQNMSDRKERATTLYVRADSADDVASLTQQIERSFDGSEVTTSQELADRIGGSLVDAKNLASKLGTALTILECLTSAGATPVLAQLVLA